MLKDNDVGDRIQFAREYRGLSRVQLAEAIGKKTRGILQWESGARNPKIEVIKDIARVLHVAPQYFIKGEHLTEDPAMIRPYLIPIDAKNDDNTIESPDSLRTADLKRIYINSRINFLTRNGLDETIKVINKELANKSTSNSKKD